MSGVRKPLPLPLPLPLRLRLLLSTDSHSTSTPSPRCARLRRRPTLVEPECDATAKAPSPVRSWKVAPRSVTPDEPALSSAKEEGRSGTGVQRKLTTASSGKPEPRSSELLLPAAPPELTRAHTSTSALPGGLSSTRPEQHAARVVSGRKTARS